MGESIFEYSQNVFKRNEDFPFEYNKALTLKLREKQFQEYDLVFSKIKHDIIITSFNFNSSIPYYYKDNIITINQKCKLDNIFIREINALGKYYRLECDYDNYTSKSYCEVNYEFTNSKSNDFQFFIGNPRNDPDSSYYYRLSHIKLIYNSIKDSTFKLGYKNPTVTISSNNFDMTHINYTKIDNDVFVYSNLFEKQSDSIRFVYNTSNIAKSYITELKRNDHIADRNITIKTKAVNLLIIERECDEFLVNYIDACVTCEVYSKILDNDSKKIWYQNGECVTVCSFSLGYAIYSNTKHLCYKCDLRTKINDNEYICGCLEGTVKSFDDDICYLPESEEIKLLLLSKKNAQCYREDGITHNYCNNNNTKRCTTYSVSGYLFPQCICKEGFKGKYCEFNENSINLKTKMDIILSDNNDDEIINEGNVTIISNVRGIIFFLEQDETQYIKNIMESTDIDRYIELCKNNIKKIISKEKNTTTQIYDVLELAIYFLKYRITNSGSTRNLKDDKNDLDYILKYAHLAHFYGNKDINQEYNIQYDNLGLTSFITYKKSIIDSDDFKHEMSNTTLFKILQYIDINENNEEDLIFVTLINNTLFGENTFGVKAYFSTNRGFNINSYY